MVQTFRQKINIILFTGFNVETIEYQNIILTAWDIGGRGKIVSRATHISQHKFTADWQ